MLHTLLSSFILVWFLVFQTNGQTKAQKPSFQNIKVYNKKTHDIDQSITGIYQDSHGFIWISGTENMYRFDGINFVSVLSLKDKNFDFPAIEAGRNDILQDHADRYWFLTASDLVRWNPKLPSNKAWDKYAPNTSDSIPFPKSKMHRLTIDAKGFLWLVFDQEHLYKIDPETGKAIQRIEFRIKEAGMHRSEIDAMEYHKEDNRIYFGADHIRIIAVNPDNGNIEHPHLVLRKLLIKSNVYEQLKNYSISDFAKDSTDWWLSLSDNSILRYSFKKNTFKLIEPNPKNTTFLVSRIKKGTDGLIWCLDPNYGLVIINPINNKITPIFNKKELQYEAPGIIRDIFFDKDSTLWLASGNGLYNYDQNEQIFYDYYTFENQIGVVPLAFFEDNQETEFIGTNKGLYFRTKFEEKFNHTINSSHLSIVRIVPWYHSCFLLGTTNGLYKYDQNEKKITKLAVTGDETTLKYYYANPAHSIMPDTVDGSPIVWLGSKLRFLYKYDVLKKQITAILPDENNPTSYHHQTIQNIIKTNNNEIWITTWGGGLSKIIDKKKILLTTYQNIPNVPNSLKNNNICDAIIAKNGNIWLPTSTGIDIFNHKFFTHITSKNGKSRYVSAVCQGKDTDIWTISGNELVRWNSEGKLLNSYQKEKYSFNSMFYKKNGEIIFWDNKTNQFNDFTSNKLYVFDSNKKSKTSSSPLTIIIGLKIMMDDSSHLLFRNHPIFAYNKNNITFDFACNSFSSTESIQFSWKLVGFDTDWTAPSAGRTFASYPNLKTGDYTFIVKSRNASSLRYNKSDSFKFTILPPWYETWTFRVLVLITCILLLWYLFNQQVRKQIAFQKLEHEKILAVSNERNRIARDLHDDLGSGLSAIHLYSEHLKNMIQQDFPQLSSELNQIVASSGDLNQKLKEIIWANESSEISLATLIGFINSFVQNRTGGVKFSIKSPNINSSIKLNQKVYKNIFLSVKECVNNALKYSGASEILLDISTNVESASIMIIIKDNGKGFDFQSSIDSGGFGLKNIMSRMDEIGGSMYVESDSSGTIIKLLIK